MELIITGKNMEISDGIRDYVERKAGKLDRYLRNMDDFPVFNRVFKEYFAGVQPARTTVEAAPPRKGVNVEIDAIAYVS